MAGFPHSIPEKSCVGFGAHRVVWRPVQLGGFWGGNGGPGLCKGLTPPWTRAASSLPCPLSHSTPRPARSSRALPAPGPGKACLLVSCFLKFKAASE